MADVFELREASGSSLCQEVTKLSAALQDYQLMVQVRVSFSHQFSNA